MENIILEKESSNIEFPIVDLEDLYYGDDDSRAE